MNEPRIDVTISFSALRVWVVVTIAAVLLAILLVGVIASPIVNGHPVVLTRERLAIKHYLDTAHGWTLRLEDIARRFDALGPAPFAGAAPAAPTAATALTLPAETPLASPYPPASQALNLYERAQQAEQAIKDVQAIDVEQQRIETPPALSGLHTLASDTLQAYIHWSAALLDHIGAPSTDSLTALQAEREAALSALAEFKAALQAQGDNAP